MSLKLNERYPGRYNNPSADYPQGSFKNRTAPGAKDGSYLEQDWANDKEGFFQSLLSLAGIVPNGVVDKVGASQFFDALQRLKQNQAGTAFPSTGPSAALVLTPSPAISAYSAGQRFRVKFNRASTGTDTINISGVGAKAIKQYDSSGAKVAAVFAIDQLADVEYDGTDVVLLDQLPAGSIVGITGSSKNLKCAATGSSATVSVTADELVVLSSSGFHKTLLAVAVSPSLANSGVNGLDAGSPSISTWYSVWVIWNGATVAGLFSLSGSNPTMPSGYTHKARVGWARTDATGNMYFLSYTQTGRKARYLVGTSNLTSLPLMASGSAGSVSGATYVAVATGSFVPPSATNITIVLAAQGQALQGIVAPNPSYGAGGASLAYLNGGTGYTGQNQIVDILLEKTNIFWASSGCTLRCYGWEDSI